MTTELDSDFRLQGSRAATDEQTRRAIEESEQRANASQSFWTVAVSVPAVLSVMRLVVEAGGELQTTLLLVANVNPVNLVAAFITTGTRMVSALLVFIFTISAILDASVPALTPERGARLRRTLIVRWKSAAPTWFVWVVIAVAALTWEILYLPWLLPALAAMYQISPSRLHPDRRVAYGVVTALLAVYGALVGPTLWDAGRQGEWLVIALLVIPPLLAVVITGPLHPAVIRGPVKALGPLVLVAAMLWAGASVLTTPVLPLTVTTVGATDDPARDTPATTEEIRGRLISVNDLHAAILQERGGVRYVPTGRVRAHVLCPSEAELPRYRLWVLGYHVENSLLEALGRAKRPSPAIGATCRVAEDSAEPTWRRE
ncbi:hypothetical protein AB0J86_03515 [Micromonospora sp. NPDC049559]|uniref:hypothetical protein n=1 Tax=Micromonospora sp. NPDC049559 TaxID=3155923 RepID=UPI003419B789